MELKDIFASTAKFLVIGVASCAVIHGGVYYLAVTSGFDVFAATQPGIAQGIDVAVNGISSLFTDSAAETAVASFGSDPSILTQPSFEAPSLDSGPSCHIDLTPEGFKEHCAPHGGSVTLG